MDFQENIESEEEHPNPKIRIIQGIHGEHTFVLCVPKAFIADLGIAKGSYVKCWVHKNRLIVEKASL